MASVTTLKNGTSRVQFTNPEGHRKAVYLGKVSAAVAETVKKLIEAILTTTSLGGDADHRIPRWLARHPKLARKLSKVGLVTLHSGPGRAHRHFSRHSSTATSPVAPTSNPVRCGPGGRRGASGRTVGGNRAIASITALEAKRFNAWLMSVKRDDGKCHFASASVSKHTSFARQFFEAAVDDRIIPHNPFRGIKEGRRSNKKRQRFISREIIDRVVDGTADAEFRLVIALSRYGGRRIPSELDGLLWQHIDLARGRILITSPKTKRYEGRESREMPLFPELVPFIDEWWNACPEQTQHVFRSNRGSESGWRTRLYKLLDRLGIQKWPRVFHKDELDWARPSSKRNIQRMSSARGSATLRRRPARTICR